MKRTRASFMSDFSIICVLALFFTGMVFLAFDSANLVLNSIMMIASFIAIITAYFFSLAAALLVVALMLLFYMAYIVLFYVPAGFAPPYAAYFWMAWMPLTTVASSLFTSSSRELLKEKQLLQLQIDRLVTVDSVTELKNLRAFENDAQVYMRLAKRYKVDLILAVWEIKGQKNMEKILDKEGLDVYVRRISDILQSSLRTEDVVYILGDEPYAWGVLLLTSSDYIDMVLLRAQKKFDAYFTGLPISMSVKYMQYQNDDISPFMFLGETQKRDETIL